MTALLAAALAFAARQWPVFPLAAGAKVPAIGSAHSLGDALRGKCRGECGRDGHGLHDANTSVVRIGEWWAANPRANVGLRTGVVVDVLDVDVKDANGLSTLVELLDQHGCLPAGPSVATPSGGLHYYFRPSGLGNAASFAPGLDWRGRGGYVVAPPSVVDATAYEWGVVPSGPLCEAPAWLVALLKPARTPSARRASKPTGTAYARQALEAEVGRLFMASEGGRNHQLNRSAFSLGQLVGAGALDALEVAEALGAAAERIGLEPDEIEKTLRSGLARGMAEPRRLPA